MSGMLFLAEMAAAVYLIIASPRKLQTLGRMALAFVVAMLVTLVPPLVLRRGDPRAWGHLAGAVAPLVAVIVGWWNMRTLRRSAPKATPAKPYS
jgi:hypothetical protein